MAEKTVEDRHGGAGSPLTVAGLAALPDMVQRIRKLALVRPLVFFAPVRQCRDTARHIATALGVEAQPKEELRPLCLGVLGGLSRLEAASRFPREAALMESWRRGEMEIRELRIPGAEDYRGFFRRGEQFLAGLPRASSDVVVVGTRSILILLVSVLLGRTIEPGGGYREISFGTSDQAVFTRTTGRFFYAPALSTVSAHALGWSASG